MDVLADDNRDLMRSSDAKRHRSQVARVVYMAQDRADLSVCACALAKSMANPKVGDEAMIKKVARYLRGRMQYVQEFVFQEPLNHLVETRTPIGRLVAARGGATPEACSGSGRTSSPTGAEFRAESS